MNIWSGVTPGGFKRRNRVRDVAGIFLVISPPLMLESPQPFTAKRHHLPLGGLPGVPVFIYPPEGMSPMPHSAYNWLESLTLTFSWTGNLSLQLNSPPTWDFTQLLERGRFIMSVIWEKQTNWRQILPTLMLRQWNKFMFFWRKRPQKRSHLG